MNHAGPVSISFTRSFLGMFCDVWFVEIFLFSTQICKQKILAVYVLFPKICHGFLFFVGSLVVSSQIVSTMSALYHSCLFRAFADLDRFGAPSGFGELHGRMLPWSAAAFPAPHILPHRSNRAPTHGAAHPWGKAASLSLVSLVWSKAPGKTRQRAQEATWGSLVRSKPLSFG